MLKGAQEQKEIRILTQSIQEFITQINLASDVFDKIVKIGLESRKAIVDPTRFGEHQYITYTGQFLGNMLKKVYLSELTPEEHTELFEHFDKCNAGANLFAMALKQVKIALDKAENRSDTIVAIGQFTHLLEQNIQLYTAIVALGVKLHTAFSNLSEDKQQLLDDIAKKVAKETLGGITGLASKPYQHLCRLPLMLKASSDYAKECPVFGLQEIGKKLLAVKEMAQEIIMDVNNHLAPKIKL
jgi:hypothetical protein